LRELNHFTWFDLKMNDSWHHPIMYMKKKRPTGWITHSWIMVLIPRTKFYSIHGGAQQKGLETSSARWSSSMFLPMCKSKDTGYVMSSKPWAMDKMTWQTCPASAKTHATSTLPEHGHTCSKLGAKNLSTKDIYIKQTVMQISNNDLAW
jgi:hypothetical protein